ncbi:MAG: ATP-binding cassette domain-containing protein [Candidatus Omnitrophica bacterium]|nr:ATP-binding cassette domain-containing protein [Candidatus Omnitrophota bacterium]
MKSVLIDHVMAEVAGSPPVLVSLSQVTRVFPLPSGKILTVLTDINFTLRDGELVAILGPSGCGKSTLIRIAAGLLQPTAGQVTYRGQPLAGPDARVALVFQQFALFPWLTVLQNIEQALVPRGIPPEARRQRVAEVITLIGLEGFEEAYPRELSGGMKQRVGIARALAVQPELLCMDEPFSQVDALTAETLRNEVVNLWRDREKYPQSILLVSHDIHEVAFMASRILIMTVNPGRIKAVIDNPLPYPRDVRAPGYQTLVNHLHDIITGLYLPEKEPEAPLVVAQATVESSGGVMAPIPLVEAREIFGLLEVVRRRGGEVEFFRLTAEMGRTFTRVLLAVKAAELLGFLETPQDRLVLTERGRYLMAASRKVRKQLFQERLIQIPLIKRLRTMFEHSAEHALKRDTVLEELAIQCPQEDPKRLLRIVINWGRFADLWTYHSSTATLTVSPPPGTSVNGGSTAPPDRATGNGGIPPPA